MIFKKLLGVNTFTDKYNLSNLNIHMKKICILFSLITHILVYSQGLFGNIPDLVFRRETVKIPSETDTLEGHLLNFHFIKDTLKGPFLTNTRSKLQGMSVFYAGNKIGGENRILLGKAGSAQLSTTGVYDYSDSLLIESPVAQPAIVTYSKKDKSRNPYVFLSSVKDKELLIPELLVFSKNLANHEKQKIETYLSLKYGISINYISEKNYLSSEGNIIWNFRDNKKYGYRITGIGRDDVFKLYQKQSSNSDRGTVTFALNEKETLNADNTGSLDNMDFLLWGDNNEALVFPVEDLLSVHPKDNMLRVWKVQAKSGAGINAAVYFRLKDMQTGSELPKLKIFRTAEDYQNNISELFSGEMKNDSILVYKNITWDLDHNGTDYFTLAQPQASAGITLVSTCNELQSGMVRIAVPAGVRADAYSLWDLNTDREAASHVPVSGNQIVLTDLNPSNYRLTVHRSGQLPDIIKTFDMEAIANQNVQDNYLWTGEPIELDINFENYHYTLLKPNGSTVAQPPYVLDGLGSYTLKVKNRLGCEIMKQINVLSQADYANHNANSLFKSIILYPNPSKDGIITVKVELKTPKPITVQIYNSLGKLLKQGQYHATDNLTSTLTIPPVTGYYNVKIFIPEESKGYNLLIH